MTQRGTFGSRVWGGPVAWGSYYPATGVVEVEPPIGVAQHVRGTVSAGPVVVGTLAVGAVVAGSVSAGVVVGGRQETN